MLFSNSIPERVLQSPNTQSFVDLLDALQCVKQVHIGTALRMYNPILCMSAKWLSKQATDFGFVGTSEDYPILPLQQLILNADNIRRLCGSKLGLKMLISAATLGEVTIDDSDFIQKIDFLFPDSFRNGFLTAKSDEQKFYLCDNNAYMDGVFLTISVESKYFDGNHTTEEHAIKSFLETFIYQFIGFSENSHITWNYSPRNDFYYHNRLNKFYYGI